MGETDRSRKGRELFLIAAQDLLPFSQVYGFGILGIALLGAFAK